MSEVGTDRTGERRARALLLFAAGGAPGPLRALVDTCGSATAALTLLDAGIAPWGPDARRGPDLTRLSARLRDAATRAALERQATGDDEAGALSMPGDPHYPALLAALADAPVLLLGRGAFEHPEPALAIVGTREPDAYGAAWATQLARAAVQAGFQVVSGGARGVDTLVHTAALEAGGRTVVVLGSGLDRPYPAQNEALFADVVRRGGLLLTEYGPALGPQARHFPERNRIVAGLGLATLVVQAPEKSGALITAARAAAAGRVVLAVPADIGYTLSAGTNVLLCGGAWPVLGVEHLAMCLASVRAAGTTGEAPRCPPGRVGETLGPRPADAGPAPSAGCTGTARARPPSAVPAGPPPPPADDAERRILESLGAGPADADTLVERSGLGPAEVGRALVRLELHDRIRPRRDGRYETTEYR